MLAVHIYIRVRYCTAITERHAEASFYLNAGYLANCIEVSAALLPYRNGMLRGFFSVFVLFAALLVLVFLLMAGFRFCTAIVERQVVRGFCFSFYLSSLSDSFVFSSEGGFPPGTLRPFGPFVFLDLVGIDRTQRSAVMMMMMMFSR